jgi:hypothetical protein
MKLLSGVKNRVLARGVCKLVHEHDIIERKQRKFDCRRRIRGIVPKFDSLNKFHLTDLVELWYV